MPNWKVWPSQPAHAFQVELVVHDVVGLPLDGVVGGGSSSAMVQVRWRGEGRRIPLIRRRAAEMNRTFPQRVRSDGTASWGETFRHDCKLKAADGRGRFRRWIVKLEIHGFGEITKYSSPILGETDVDISAFAALGEEKRMLSVPIHCRARRFSAEAMLTVSLKISNARTTSGTPTITRASSMHATSTRVPSRIDREHVGRPSAHGSARLSAAVSPSQATHWNLGGEFSPLNDLGRSLEDGQGKRAKRSLQGTYPNSLSRTQSLRNLFSWTTGNPGSRSVKHHREGTPQLHEALRDGGFDDIDHHECATQSTAVCSSNSTPPRCETHDQVSNFEEEEQVDIGSWEETTVASRDGCLELVTQVFLASIDQRSEKAAGESACSVLAAVIADWLHRNRRTLPLRCQFDDLVREGSSEWRKLCADEARMEQFSDRHLDLETVLGSKVRPLAMVTDMSYVAFFSLETTSGQTGFDCLDAAMSFDAVWENLVRVEAGEERVYIAGWNDHFFVLKVEEETVYLVDTLGERLFEGCNQAYILKFDKNSKVHRTREQEEAASTSIAGSFGGGEAQEQLTSGSPTQKQEAQRSPEQSTSEIPAQQQEAQNSEASGRGSTGERDIVCEGLDSCKEFIKGFLAAVPLRELRGDMERGSVEGAHHLRLRQIEFHYTCLLQL